MTKKQKLEAKRYENSAQIHVRKRLAQRYPNIYRTITMADLKESPSLKLFPTHKGTRIVTAVLIHNKDIVYIIKTVSNNMVHTVLTVEQVKDRLAELSLGFTLDERLVREGILSKYNTYQRYMEVLRGEE